MFHLATRATRATRRSLFASFPSSLLTLPHLSTTDDTHTHLHTSHFFSSTPTPPDTKPTPPPPSSYLSRLAHANTLKSGEEEPALPWDVVLRSGAACFVGIGCLTGLHYGVFEGNMDLTMVLGSFGATAVLVYGYPGAPFSQPKNVIAGHVLSAALGIACHTFVIPYMDGSVLIAAPLAVSLSTMGMMALGCVHPPAGGTCLIACLGSPLIVSMGWSFLFPTLFGSSFLVGTAYLINNASSNVRRKYPAKGWLG